MLRIVKDKQYLSRDINSFFFFLISVQWGGRVSTGDNRAHKPRLLFTLGKTVAAQRRRSDTNYERR